MRNEAQILSECEEILKTLSGIYSVQLELKQIDGLSRYYNLYCDKKIVYKGTLRNCDLVIAGLMIPAGPGPLGRLGGWK